MHNTIITKAITNLLLFFVVFEDELQVVVEVGLPVLVQKAKFVAMLILYLVGFQHEKLGGSRKIVGNSGMNLLPTV